MKLWLDDRRAPPDESWSWATTIEDAKRLLQAEPASEQSLDHDLNLENGHMLVVWELDHDRVPPLTIVHSWSRRGGQRMTTLLRHHGHHVIHKPELRPPK